MDIAFGEKRLTALQILRCGYSIGPFPLFYSS